MKTQKIRVGFDFDGVVAYNPFRIIRPIIAYVKRDLLGIRTLNFFYPQNRLQQVVWTLLHESSIFPAQGTALLKKYVSEGKIEAHLITARYSFLDSHLDQWLEKHDLKKTFKTINLNNKNEQPHIFKEKTIGKYKLDYFIEDNFDIVKHLSKKDTNKVYWIYNILDKTIPYEHKHPHLESALKKIVSS